MQLGRALAVSALVLRASGARAEDDPRPEDYRDVFDPKNKPAPRDGDDGTVAHRDSSGPITGFGRVGVYFDSDQTLVVRALSTVAKTWDRWSASATVSIDAVSSASIDVRTSPLLGQVDAVSSATGMASTTGAQMSDTRYQGVLVGGWRDNHGAIANATLALAGERDYTSISGGVNGSYDVLDRTTTLLGGITLTDNWVSSVLDPTLHRKMVALGWSAGIARVLTRSDAVRVRYDGRFADGYQASPYREVRFGDWTTSANIYNQIIFSNTIGTADGVPELVPQLRLGSALVLEWMHSLGRGVGLRTAVRLSHDSWGIDSVTPSLELRVARRTWRFLAGYRFYAQSRASFFEDKYTMAPTMYEYYTADKELGREVGHLVELEVTRVIRERDDPNDTRMVLFSRVDGIRYAYPGFELLPNRASLFLEIGLGWEM